jgi:uncharacterized membrane protein YhiD involved in acid resistance
MSNDLSIFFETAALYAWPTVVVNTLLAILLGFSISTIYKHTHSGLSYSKSFVLMLIMVTITSATAMMIIGNNVARAFALVGALSIIRFRTVIKDTRDIAFIFAALVSGMAAGTSAYFISIFSTTTLLSLLVFLHNRNYGTLIKKEFILRIDTSSNNTEEILAISSNSVESMKVLEVEGSGAANQFIQLTYDVVLKDTTEIEEFIRDISNVQGIRNVQLIASKHDVDY